MHSSSTMLDHVSTGVTIFPKLPIELAQPPDGLGSHPDHNERPSIFY